MSIPPYEETSAATGASLLDRTVSWSRTTCFARDGEVITTQFFPEPELVDWAVSVSQFGERFGRFVPRNGIDPSIGTPRGLGRSAATIVVPFFGFVNVHRYPKMASMRIERMKL
ncbi:hypothetical protein LOK49_LG11G02510 [Camellia lanceoleosa]|uniref:Uncharacterized protein n=1 Tax=Camellia lanceoleosa TaxID=1840588 RepID=A0ACC0FZX3_9ERIC|nr:hypothetical protein LOK49_LG11G02510 [Camellia lanceoleosa]